jgi:hypothetical protein
MIAESKKVVTMVTKLITNDNSFKPPLQYSFLDKVNLLTRQEKEKFVLDLYNQGKTYREIAQELRISPRDIGFILRKAAAEEEGEEENEKEYADKKTEQEEEQQLSISSQAYKLFYTGKGPIDVAIELNLPEQQVTKLHKQYCKLREINSLNMIYEEIGDKHFMSILRLYLDIKSKGISIEQLGNALEIVDKLPELQKRFESLQNDIRTAEHQKLNLRDEVQLLNVQRGGLEGLLESHQVDYKNKKLEIECLEDEKNRLEDFVNRFKNSNEDYLKIERIVQEKVNSILNHNKLLLVLAVTAVIEAFRNDPNKNALIHNITTIDSPSATTTSGDISRYSFEFYKSTILEIATQLYNRMLIDLRNSTMMAATRATVNSS